MTAPGAGAGGRGTRLPWLRFVVESPPALAEEIAVFLSELTGRGVETAPGEGTGRRGWPRVAAYLSPGPGLPALEERIGEHLRRLGEKEGEGPSVLSREVVAGEDWGRTWKEHFRAARVSRRIVVRPPWDKYIPDGGEVVIEIEPGMAFGTGLHASTRLVLGLVDDLWGKIGGELSSVLDVGTGTGILAIAAALLGARRVLALDNDPEALAAAAENVSRNGLGERVDVRGAGLDGVGESFDLVTANIVHDTLADLAPALAARLAPRGTLLLAGILAGAQEESLARIFGGLGLSRTASRCEGEWAAMGLERA